MIYSPKVRASALKAGSGNNSCLLWSSPGLKAFPRFLVAVDLKQPQKKKILRLVLHASAGEGRRIPYISVELSVRGLFGMLFGGVSPVSLSSSECSFSECPRTSLTFLLVSLQTPVKEPNSENVDISSGGGVTGWKSKCC